MRSEGITLVSPPRTTVAAVAAAYRSLGRYSIEVHDVSLSPTTPDGHFGVSWGQYLHYSHRPSVAGQTTREEQDSPDVLRSGLVLALLSSPLSKRSVVAVFAVGVITRTTPVTVE